MGTISLRSERIEKSEGSAFFSTRQDFDGAFSNKLSEVHAWLDENETGDEEKELSPPEFLINGIHGGAIHLTQRILGGMTPDQLK